MSLLTKYADIHQLTGYGMSTFQIFRPSEKSLLEHSFQIMNLNLKLIVQLLIL